MNVTDLFSLKGKTAVVTGGSRDYCKTENMSIAEFAISYIRDTEGVTSLVLGADTKEQVMENIKYINASAISEKTRIELSEKFKEVNIMKIMDVLSRPKK